MKKNSKNSNSVRDKYYEPDYYDPYHSYDDDEVSTIKSKRRKRIVLWLITLGIIAILADLSILLYTGKIWFNSPTRKEYPVQGITLSSLQGDINFNALEIENISFAYLKATEGKSLKDLKFAASWESSKDSTVKTSAYHKFSFFDNGKDQAENFIKTVGNIPKDGYRLLPAVEVTKSGAALAYLPNKETIVSELLEYCDTIKDEYGVYPIIITGDKFYKKYLKNDFSGYKLWITDLFSKPNSINWSLWNYSPRGKLNGTSNTKNYISLSVFNGTRADFTEFQYK